MSRQRTGSEILAIGEMVILGIIILGVILTIVLCKVTDNQYDEAEHRCAEKGGVLIDEYHCIDKDAVK